MPVRGVVLSVSVAMASLATIEDGAAQAPRESGRPGAIAVDTIESPAIADNLLGEPSAVEVAVYTPPGYGDEDLRYPTIYLLHGIGGSFRDWTDGGYQGLHIDQLLDSLIMAREIPPSVVVMPTAFNRYLGSYYADSPVTGDWGRFIGEELVGWVDASYRTIAAREGRAIAGHSMGGFGAIMAGAHYPDVFAAAWAMSPCCLLLDEDLGAANAGWARSLAFDAPADVGEALEEGDFYAVAIMGLLSVALPDTTSPPFYVARPYTIDDQGFRLEREPAFSRYRRFFPAARLDDLAPALRRLSGLGVDTGHNDQFPHIPPGAMALSEGLAERNVPHVFEVYEGDHRDRIRERLATVVLPSLTRHLEGPRP